MSFGDYVGRIRRKRGLSKAKLAAQADLSVVTIDRIEASNRTLTIQSLDKAADQLGLEVVIKFVPKPEAAPAS